ncbi:methylisocitrate lyase [Paenibacillus sp. YAF4_2]|uniref:methylisocitrate lyase n=1 Tax=Paenibacillus sp. YAF4_2 TaxID=3233085 RepID=UPI003F992378
MASSPGHKLREAVVAEQPLQVAGAINAYAAMMVEQVGFRALYLSGAGVANASFGLPDLGITTLQDVLEDIRRITSVTELPLLVDIDTGFGGAFQISRTIKEMQRAGVAAVHIEDQVAEKRCGHRPNKAMVSTSEMVDRIKAAVDAKTDSSFVIMARTDALTAEGMEAAAQRVRKYVEAGADMIFPEAVGSLAQYKQFAEAAQVPILANITEFGQTPLFTIEELREAGVGLALYPLSAFRAMNAAALRVYRSIREEGTQHQVVNLMQTRSELYDFLRYYDYETKLDQLFGTVKKEEKGEG